MITVFTIRLYAEEPVTLPEFSGTVAKSVFLKLVAAADAQAALRAHQGAKPRPYSVTPLLLNGAPAPRLTPPGATLELRVAIADDALAEKLLHAIVAGHAYTLQLGAARLRTASIDSAMLSHSDLPAGRFQGAHVEYITPVRFSVAPTGKRHRPKFRLFPTPERLFNSLYKHWNLYAPPGMQAPDWIPQLVQDYVAESGYHIRRTALRGTGGRVFVGTTGWVNYIPVEDFDDHGWLTRLLAYGQLFNAGTGRSIGLGVMRYTPHPRREPPTPG